MQALKNESGVAVMLLLLLVPLLMGVCKMTLHLSQVVSLKQKMREQCFLASLTALQNRQNPEAVTTELASQLPDTAVTLAEEPNSETDDTENPPRRLVFNLKNKFSNFNCGAIAQWKNQTWDYEIFLDKL